MWLLYRGSDGELALEKFHSKDVPKYAILSHRWLPEDEEPQFHHLHPRPATPETKRKAGYAKLEFCVSEATRDGFGYSWVDTVCINKSSSSELNEAIVSMFRWYGESAKCYAYLNDVAGKSNLCSSKWFTRGWTLQELIAPKEVEFFSSDRQFIGTKSSLEREIKAVTGIPPEALRGRRLSEFSVPDRISWVKNRETTRAEDQAYCMMGIFNVFMPIIYGEGNQAWNRLLEEVDKKGKGK
ncbi:HET-domain-containing protein [Hyaloscypha hepaticicola]|uniref:HET-domain-containing protein n=1 Tax=Hyaloscypha hepaticicola TaxID=2082293 RepID=A0A2J6PDW2_9HELO|nr:HET-domain-containing protein [Hyaloscypha hepaticicola]